MVGKTKVGSKNTTEQVESVVTTEKRKKSPGRAKSPGRQKSPGRPKSPGRRSPGRTSPARTKPVETAKTRPGTPTRTGTRTKSPSRLKVTPPTTSSILTPSRRSPIRRSPARVAKEPSEEKEKDFLATRRKQKKIVDTDTDSDNNESVPEIKEKPKAAVRGRTRRIDIEIEPEDKVELKHQITDEINSVGLTRRFTRASQNREVERVIHLQHFDTMTVTKRLGEFSDEDEGLAKKSQPERQEFSEAKLHTEFGGVFGALLFIIGVPLTVIASFVLCNESHCSFTKVPDLQRYRMLSTYFDAKSMLGVIAYVTLVGVLSALPFGGRKLSGLPNKHEKLDYVMNGFFSFVVILAIGIGLQLKGVPIVDYIVDHIFHMLIASILFGVFLSVYVYIRSFYVPISALNTHVVGKDGIYAFFMGREVNPRIFSLIDLKMFSLRALAIAVLLFDFAYLYHTIEFPSATKKAENEEYDPARLYIQPTLLVYVLLHSIYFLDGLMSESSWVTSFEVQKEGYGYMLAMGYFVYPFLTASAIKYMVEHGVELETWKLVLSSLAFAVGYIIYRGSNNQKDAFRKNPYSPSLSHLETIPTTQGKKLLVSGFWGIIRHPNYLGDMLIHSSFVPFVICAPPVICSYFTIFMLIHRASRDNARCKQKYGAAWDRYCNRVKYVLIPKVY